MNEPDNRRKELKYVIAVMEKRMKEQDDKVFKLEKEVDEIKKMCNTFKTITEYATTVCNKFSQRVRRLSGLGMQLSSTTDDLHRPCRLACQDEKVFHRFYLVNGEEGWFPFGTDCTLGDVNRKAFCVHGKCLEFNADNLPSQDFDQSFSTVERIKREAGDHSESHQSETSYRESLPSVDLMSPINLKRNDAIELSNADNPILGRKIK